VGKPPVRTYWFLPAAFILVRIGYFVLSGAVPCGCSGSFSQTSVLELRSPTSNANMPLTRQAYNLDQIAARPFAAEQSYLQHAGGQQGTIENIRLWDWLPLVGYLRAAARDPHLLQIPYSRR